MEGELSFDPTKPLEQTLAEEVLEKRDVAEIIAWGERVMRGEFSGDLDDYEEQGEMVHVEGSEGEYEMEDGVLLDMNDQKMSDEDKATLVAWMESKLEASLGSASLSARYRSADGETTFHVFAKRFGAEENPWYLSQWQNEGEEPSYILWSGEMYDQQEELGYEQIEEES